MKRLTSLATLILLFVCAFAQQMTPLPLKPEVKTGVLSNGLTYYILHNEQPKNRANFYMIQKVGSVLENQDQRGFAYFLEHMAFKGTSHYPGRTMLNYLQSKGIRFGADINAYTSFDETVYNIDNVITTDKPLMDSVLLVIRDWCDGILLEESEIEAERGVINEEWRSRSDAQNRMYTAILPQIFEEYQYQQMPIGKMEVVMNFKPETLRAYYKKWYRPDLQGIVIVGDFDADEMEKKVKELFSTVNMPFDVPAREYVEISDNQEPIFVMFQDPELPSSMVQTYFKQDKMPWEMRNTVEGYMSDTLIKNILIQMLQNRLDEYLLDPECPYAQATVNMGCFLVAATKDAFEISVVAKDEIVPAYNAAMGVVARACKTGFSQNELESVTAELLNTYEKIFKEKEMTDNSKYGQELIRHFIENKPTPGIEVELQLAKQLLPMLKVEVYNVIAQQLLTEENQVIVVNQSLKDDINAVNDYELIAALSNTYEFTRIPKQENIRSNDSKDNAVAIMSHSNKTIVANNVNDYISSKLPDITDFIKDRTLNIEIPTAEKMRNAIEADITTWQIKGEFETTSDWNNRVNDETRNARIAKLTNVWKEKIKIAKDLYDEKAKNAQLEYQHLRKKYADEYYAYKTQEALRKCSDGQMSLNSPYDADNQVFLINSSFYGDILLNVPIDDAPEFKKNWDKISKSISYEFIPADENGVALSKIIFSMNGKKYTYDGKSDAAYSIADINYNFNPIEIEDIDFDINSLPEFAETSPINTLTTTGITAKKVNVNRTLINASNGQEVTERHREKSDIDKNVPIGNKNRKNTFALIVANENYRRVSEVPYALNDGSVIYEYFNKTLGIPEKNILTAEDASLNDIRYNLKQLQEICVAFEGDASVIVYYAGHGVPDGKSLDAYLLPVDGYADDPSTGLALSELTRNLSDMSSKQTILFIDACFSGTGREGGMLSEARGVKLRPKEVNVNGNLVVFSASQGVETAHPLEEEEHGMFTYYLLKKLNESHGKVKLGELAEYIIKNVRRASVLEGSMQSPTVKTSLSDWESLEL